MKNLFTNKSFLIIFFAQSASGLGNTFAIFIMSWLLYSLSESTLAMGTLWFVYMTGIIISHLISGPYLDYIDRKKVMIFSEWTRAIIFIVPLLMQLLGYLNPIIIFLVALVVGLVEPLFRPSRTVYTKEVVSENQLTKANALLEGNLQTMMLAGPALGGILVALFGPNFILLLLIIIMALAGFILLLLPDKKSIKTEEKFNWLKEFKEGFGFYRDNKLFLWITILAVIVNFGAGAVTPMLLPYVVENFAGTSFQYGLLSSAIALGMVLGSLLLGVTPEFRNLKTIMLGSLVLSGVFLSILGITNIFILAVIFIMLHGFFIVVFNINNTTLYQKKVPGNLLGRVLSIRSMVARLSIPLGAIIGGFLAEFIGVKSLFIILGLIIMFPTIIAWFLPSFKELTLINNNLQNDIKEKSE